MEELSSLLEPERRSSDLYIDPIFDKKLRFCRTSDKMLGSESAFIINFGLGYPNCFDMDKRYHVRAVRALQSGVSPGKTNMMKKPAVRSKPTTIVFQRKKPKYRLRCKPMHLSREEAHVEFNLNYAMRPNSYMKNDFEEAGNGVVIDHATGLMWQKSGSDKLLKYLQAKSFIIAMNEKKIAGFNDWRLPTVNELVSLLELKSKRNGLHIDPVFDKKQTWCWASDTWCWSSARSIYSPFGVNLVAGQVNFDSMDDEDYVRAVRDLNP